MPSIPRRRLVRCLAASAMLAAAAAWGRASDFPVRPVTLLVPFSAGGATDGIVRHLADLAGRALGQPVIVDNKPGAGGVLGANQLVHSAPDGYTLSILPETVFRLPHLQKMQFDPLRDFSYVIHLSGYALCIATRRDAPWTDWAAVVADAKARPGQISYGTTGMNSTMHLTVEKMAQLSGIELNHVPYKGESEIIAALMGGHIDLGITAGSIVPLVDDGKARVLVSRHRSDVVGCAQPSERSARRIAQPIPSVLASDATPRYASMASADRQMIGDATPVLWTARRVPRWPDVPTLRDIGLDMVATSPFGIAGPRNLPPAVVKTLHDAFRKALEAPVTQALLERLNQESAYLDSAAYAAFARERFEAARRQVARMSPSPGQTRHQ
ncbi:tripartite tricarboxylate transporter substrate binding protein [Verminephrobacter eiseniae]|uniref:tripartite tricarboxylate transporter substrate binding protein n=1 Tax=Verminephrobacter eiseniae TaxID=364317 RepID=UPI0022387217|nr:tripartite tricarboxylate transporter substrate binding protein [Verminephrobacter eiseniae]MCW5263367.1 tripartite tricarboxylate transporter substrate binding protein [Verminephrobacter eiseniae]